MTTRSPHIGPASAARGASRRPRVSLLDASRLTGHWGFAPAGREPMLARGKLELLPTGKAHWQPPPSARLGPRQGLWCVRGQQLVLALDGGTLFAGPAVPFRKHMLWGRGVWVRLPRAQARPPSLLRVRPRPVGTRVMPARPLTPVVAAVVSTVVVALGVASFLPL